MKPDVKHDTKSMEMIDLVSTSSKEDKKNSSHSDNDDNLMKPDVKCDIKREMIDLVSTSSGENKKVACDIKMIDPEVQEVQEQEDKCDEKHDLIMKEVQQVQEQDVGDEKHDVINEERPESPNHSVVQVSRKTCKIVHKVPPT